MQRAPMEILGATARRTPKGDSGDLSVRSGVTPTVPPQASPEREGVARRSGGIAPEREPHQRERAELDIGLARRELVSRQSQAARRAGLQRSELGVGFSLDGRPLLVQLRALLFDARGVAGLLFGAAGAARCRGSAPHIGG